MQKSHERETLQPYAGFLPAVTDIDRHPTLDNVSTTTSARRFGLSRPRYVQIGSWALSPTLTHSGVLEI